MIFNDAQEACLQSHHKKIIVNASAGTGKTTTLVEAAKRSIAHGDKVVLITFTRDAAESIENKLSYRAAFTGTIHAFALREIIKISKKHIFKNKIMTNDQVKATLVQAIMRLDNGIKKGYKEDITKVLVYQNNRYYDDRNSLKRIFKILKEYDKIKTEYGLFDINDSPQYLLELIKTYKWKLKYDGLFVDEVQDIDQYEFELIQKFNCRTFLIGDPKQSIYIFRNSIENIFDKFENLGYNLFILTDNYRSYQEIIDYAQADLYAARGYGGVITNHLLLLENPQAQILCRTNREVEQLSPLFTNVSTIHAFKGLEAEDVVHVAFQTQSQESENIKFVALTRAKNRLGIASFSEVYQLGKQLKKE